ncbi:MAG TPA: hypothetical protein VK154_13310 [Chitinophagales bacterium]|nr:hypothetical protein [Chitinophagales bacterium]
MFTHKALTTWGEVEDFKHFLPRIFELMATSEFADDVTILYKLDYGEFDTWDETEKDAVKQFLLAWWADVAAHKNWFNKELFIEALKRTGDIKPLLQSWVINEKDNSIRNIVNFIHFHFIDVIKPAYLFKQMEQADRLYFIKWINRQTPLLENAFFHFEKKDPEFAQEISNALYILEHNTIDI